MATPDISKLIVRTALRDRQAFDLLYRHTSRKLFGVCIRVLKNEAEAEDALQEVFIRIWNKADRFAASDLSPISWLVAIARNLCIDRLRARKPVVSDDDALVQMADPAPDPEQSAQSSSMRGRISECLGELDSTHAGAVKAAYLEGESYNELAERFAVPLNTMRSWLRRSLLKLRECLAR
ncbi:MAG: sigma-70 family RNA polymerase sigma factor [Salinarimonas sp.]